MQRDGVKYSMMLSVDIRTVCHKLKISHEFVEGRLSELFYVVTRHLFFNRK